MTDSKFKQAYIVLCETSTSGQIELSEKFRDYQGIRDDLEAPERKVSAAESSHDRMMVIILKTKIAELTERWEATSRPAVDAALGLVAQSIYSCIHKQILLVAQC